jgi:hypothetical protein
MTLLDPEYTRYWTMIAIAFGAYLASVGGGVVIALYVWMPKIAAALRIIADELHIYNEREKKMYDIEDKALYMPIDDDDDYDDLIDKLVRESE